MTVHDEGPEAGLETRPETAGVTASLTVSETDRAAARPGPSARTSALIVVAALALTGAALGVVWSGIAPPIHTITALTRGGERADAFLGREADNLFVAAAMMIGLLCMTAVVSALLVWQWRVHRGPTMATALWVGQIVAGGAATGVGAALAHARYGTADHAGVALSKENRVHYFTEAPPVFVGHSPLQIAVTLLLPAALAALVYAMMTVANPRDDLGAWPPAFDERPLV
jgi:hypothetical protein